MTVKNWQTDETAEMPPHLKQTEQALLACLMLAEVKEFSEMLPQVTPDLFYLSSHRSILKGIISVNSGDLSVLSDHFSSHGLVSEIGGVSYLSELMLPTHTTRNFGQYLKLLREAAGKRRIREIGLRAVDESSNGTPPAELKRELIDQLNSISTDDKEVPDLAQCVLTPEMMKTIDIPEREEIIERVLPTQSLFMINAGRGKGKTFLALGFGKACAVGEGAFLGWSVKRKAKVLYIDGEMPLSDMRERISQLQIPAENFLLLSVEWMICNGITKRLNIASLEGQALIDKTIEDLSRGGFKPDVLILDNYSALIHGIKQNDNDEWDGINAWLIRKRHTGLSVIVLDHAGKDETRGSRGASRKEDVMDTIIQLSEVKGAEPDECRFTIEFTKTRGRKPSPMKFVASLRGADFTTEEIEINSLDGLVQLVNDGVEQQAYIAAELKVSPAYVSRMVKKAVQQGLIRKSGNKLKPTLQ